MIEFGHGERIENVAVGDSSAWQVTPNKRANLLFLKPLFGKAQDQHDGGHRPAHLSVRPQRRDAAERAAVQSALHLWREAAGGTAAAAAVAYPSLLANAPAAARSWPTRS